MKTAVRECADDVKESLEADIAETLDCEVTESAAEVVSYLGAYWARAEFRNVFFLLPCP